ncbi:pyruvate kinase [bacterium]|nr:pyruvate kinase [bacterium]
MTPKGQAPHRWLDDLPHDKSVISHYSNPIRKKGVSHVSIIHQLNRRTKIIATLGPASDSSSVLDGMIRAGVNVIRVNASHFTDPQRIIEAVANIRSVAESAGAVVGVMLDLQGPKIRIGKVKDNKITLHVGDRLDVSTLPGVGHETWLGVSYPHFATDVKPDEVFYIDDGKIQLRVLTTDGTSAHCEVLMGGVVSNHKGVNLPNTMMSMSSLTDKDLADVKAGMVAGVDYVALSFVSRPHDVFELRAELGKSALRDIKIISKIERKVALDHIQGIVEASDGIMVARGDLGVEIGVANVPKAQKMIIREANRHIKPVIVATQMLESMINGRTATRAEVSDVANAIYDQCDAVMLSAETAVGIDPVNVIETMATICMATDQDMAQMKQTHATHLTPFASHSAATSICVAADQIANENNASVILAFTSSGNTPLIASKLNPMLPIIAPTDDPDVLQRMALYRGVIPMMMPKAFKDIHRWTDMITLAIHQAILHRFLSKGNTVVVTAGIPIGQSNGINSIRIVTA